MQTSLCLKLSRFPYQLTVILNKACQQLLERGQTCGFIIKLYFYMENGKTFTNTYSVILQCVTADTMRSHSMPSGWE